MSGRYDNAAIIVAVLTDDGETITSVRRYLSSEVRTYEAHIAALFNDGRRFRVTFIERWDNGLDDVTRERFTAAVPT